KHRGNAGSSTALAHRFRIRTGARLRLLLRAPRDLAVRGFTLANITPFLQRGYRDRPTPGAGHTGTLARSLISLWSGREDGGHPSLRDRGPHWLALDDGARRASGPIPL